MFPSLYDYRRRRFGDYGAADSAMPDAYADPYSSGASPYTAGASAPFDALTGGGYDPDMQAAITARGGAGALRLPRNNLAYPPMAQTSYPETSAFGLPSTLPTTAAMAPPAEAMPYPLPPVAPPLPDAAGQPQMQRIKRRGIIPGITIPMSNTGNAGGFVAPARATPISPIRPAMPQRY